MKGDYVLINSEILIYHVFSNTYLKASRQKSQIGDNNLLCLKLTRIINSATHFNIKINPILVFKKEGEKISYDD